MVRVNDYISVVKVKTANETWINIHGHFRITKIISSLWDVAYHIEVRYIGPSDKQPVKKPFSCYYVPNKPYIEYSEYHSQF